MGDYTTFHFRTRIRRDAEPVRTILKDVAQNRYRFYELSPAPNHSFFNNERQGMIIWGHYADYTFPPPTFDEHTGILTFTCMLKNYESTIEEFLDWVKPAILTPKPLRNYIGCIWLPYADIPYYMHLTKYGEILYTKGGDKLY